MGHRRATPTRYAGQSRGPSPLPAASGRFRDDDDRAPWDGRIPGPVAVHAVDSLGRGSFSAKSAQLHGAQAIATEQRPPSPAPAVHSCRKRCDHPRDVPLFGDVSNAVSKGSARAPGRKNGQKNGNGGPITAKSGHGASMGRVGSGLPTPTPSDRPSRRAERADRIRPRGPSPDRRARRPGLHRLRQSIARRSDRNPAPSSPPRRRGGSEEGAGPSRLGPMSGAAGYRCERRDWDGPLERSSIPWRPRP